MMIPIGRLAGPLILVGCMVGVYGNISCANSRVLAVSVVEPFDTRVLLDETLRVTKSSVGESIKLTLCADEYQPASFLVEAGPGRPRKVRIIVGRISTLDGNDFQGTIDVRVVKRWFQAAGAWDSEVRRKGEPPVLVPELLLKDQRLVFVDRQRRANYLRVGTGRDTDYRRIGGDPVRESQDLPSVERFDVRDSQELQELHIDGRAAEQLWVTVHASKTAKAGRYKGAVRIVDVSSGDFVEVPLDIDILPFKLHQPALSYSIYYRGKLDPRHPTISSEFKSEKQLRAELIDIREHGIGNPAILQRYLPKGELELTSKEQALVWFDRHLAIRAELGMTGSELFMVGLVTGDSESPNDLKSIATIAGDIRRRARDAGYQAVSLYGLDEARLDVTKRQQRAWFAVREAGVHVFAAANAVYSGMEPDVLVMHGALRSDVAAHMHAIGKRVFSYGNPQSGPENPELFRRHYGYDLLAAGYDGAMIYAYQHSMGNIWDDGDHIYYRDHVLAYPTSDGVIDTIAWEALREAIDDVRYVSTLKARLRDVRAGLVSAPAGWTKLAENLLREIKPNVDIDPEPMTERVRELLRSSSLEEVP